MNEVIIWDVLSHDVVVFRGFKSQSLFIEFDESSSLVHKSTELKNPRYPLHIIEI